MKMIQVLRPLLLCWALAPLAGFAAQSMGDAGLVAALQQGGLVVLMRHASSPRDLPDEATRQADNATGERQLDAKGRLDASAMGTALRRLGIGIGEVLSSPTYRARETAELMGLEQVISTPELSNEGMRTAAADKAQWLLETAAQPVRTGNRLLITHAPNISAAFPTLDALEDGEALVLQPNPAGAPNLLGRIRIERWPALQP